MMDKNWRMLVVEDDPDGQEVVAHILGYMNFQFDVANDGDEAIAYLQQAGASYNAVLIDLALPGKDGWQVLHEIQANPETAHIPCLAVTGYHSSKMRDEAIKAGFVAYFAKPIDATSFTRQLEAIL